MREHPYNELGLREVFKKGTVCYYSDIVPILVDTPPNLNNSTNSKCFLLKKLKRF